MSPNKMLWAVGISVATLAVLMRFGKPLARMLAGPAVEGGNAKAGSADAGT